MDRFLLTLSVFAVFALCLGGMWWGWRRQVRVQQAQVPRFPSMPATAGEPVLEASGRYVSTTHAGHWQRRIAAWGVGVPGPAVLRLYPDGIEVDRAGATRFWIPRDSIVTATTAAGMAGKVMGTSSLLVFRWRLGDLELDTGFRGADLSVYSEWIEQVRGGAQV